MLEGIPASKNGMPFLANNQGKGQGELTSTGQVQMFSAPGFIEISLIRETAILNKTVLYSNPNQR